MPNFTDGEFKALCMRISQNLPLASNPPKFCPERLNVLPFVRKVTVMARWRAPGRGSQACSEQEAPEPCQPVTTPVLVRNTTN